MTAESNRQGQSGYYIQTPELDDHVILHAPPQPQLRHQVSASVDSLFVFDSRLWHGSGANLQGHPRRAICDLYINGTKIEHQRAAFRSKDVVEFSDTLIRENTQLIPLPVARRE